MHKILTLVACCLFVGCGDRIQSDLSDLEKYPWVATFTLGGREFSKIEHNLDTGRYAFSFRSDYPADEYFSIVDVHAKKQGWVIARTSGCAKRFERPSTIFPAATGKDLVSIEYRDGGRIILEYRPNVMAD